MEPAMPHESPVYGATSAYCVHTAPSQKACFVEKPELLPVSPFHIVHMRVSSAATESDAQPFRSFRPSGLGTTLVWYVPSAATRSIDRPLVGLNDSSQT